MKPFDLEAAKRGSPLINRQGQAVKFICVEPDADVDTRLLVLTEGRVTPLYENGKYYDVGVSEKDVFMAPKKKIVWINLYKEGFLSLEHFSSGYVYETEMLADANCLESRIGGKAWSLEIEE